jgi:dUTP pyrophosphatase
MKIECILSHGAKPPKRNNPTDAGLDIEIRGYRDYLDDIDTLGSEVWFDEENHDHSGVLILRPKERVLAMTGVKIALPTCEDIRYVYEIQVRPRSGLALKKGISIVNSPGTVDQEYRGDIGVILINTSNKNVYFKDGEKIAQLVINKVRVDEEFVVVDEFSKQTVRGEKGYGSSDFNKGLY